MVYLLKIMGSKKKEAQYINMVFSTWFQGNRHKLRLSYKDAIRISEEWIISY